MQQSVHGPFDDPSRPETPETPQTPSSPPGKGYNLQESYLGESSSIAPSYSASQERPDSGYTNSYFADPTTQFGIPGRASSPYGVDSDSLEGWKQRQAPGGVPGSIRRYPTRKIKLQHGAVLSVDHAVPSAIQNSVQAKYRNDLESGSEEFTHMRCRIT